VTKWSHVKIGQTRGDATEVESSMPGFDGDADPALEAAGLEKRVPYSMRDTFASFSLAAGVPLLWLARLMGTSAEMIDKTYGHMLPDSPEHIRGLLDAYDARDGQLSDTGD
jgi:integrase